MTRVIGYVRVSTEEQAREGLSLAHQKARIRHHCDVAGLELVDIELDAGLSASTLAREGLERARAAIGRDEASGLVVVKLDRLTRSVRDLVALKEQGMGESWSLVSLAEAVDTKTPTGRMFLTLIVTLAEWERETTAARVKDTLAHARAQGQPLGAVPFGYKRVKVERDAGGRRVGPQGRLVEDEAQQRVIALMRALRDRDGYSQSQIAAALNADGVLGAQGKARSWTATSVRRVLKASAPQAA